MRTSSSSSTGPSIRVAPLTRQPGEQATILPTLSVSVAAFGPYPERECLLVFHPAYWPAVRPSFSMLAHQEEVRAVQASSARTFRDEPSGSSLFALVHMPLSKSVKTHHTRIKPTTNQAEFSSLFRFFLRPRNPRPALRFPRRSRYTTPRWGNCGDCRSAGVRPRPPRRNADRCD